MGNKHHRSSRKKYLKKEEVEAPNEVALNLSKKEESELPKEIELFLKEKNIIPCALKSDSSGNILSYIDCFEKVQISDIKYRKEGISEHNIFETEYENLNKNIETLDTQTFIDISCIHCDPEFKRKAEKKDGTTKKKTSIVIKYILYSFSIDQQYIQLSPYWIGKIRDIANSYDSDEEKAKELDEIFKVIGYFIPLEVKVGGLFTCNTDETKNDNLNKINNELNYKTNFESNLLFQKKFENNNDENSENDKGNGNTSKIIVKGKGNGSWKETNDKTKNDKYFLNHSIIKGGNIYAKNLEEWVNSLTFKDSEIIEYLNITKVKNILDGNLKNMLKIPLEMVEKKYKMRKDYIKTFEKLKNMNIHTQYRGNSSISQGICEEKECPLIVCKKFDAKGDGSFLRKLTLSVCESFNDIIVGYHINSCWHDGTNGEWKLNEDPILKKSINIYFESQKNRGESFEVFVYLMKFPE